MFVASGPMGGQSNCTHRAGTPVLGSWPHAPVCTYEQEFAHALLVLLLQTGDKEGHDTETWQFSGVLETVPGVQLVTNSSVQPVLSHWQHPTGVLLLSQLKS